MQMFARYGVPEYWIVDTSAKEFEVYRLAAAGYTLVTTATSTDLVRSPGIKDLVFPAAHVFASE